MHQQIAQKYNIADEPSLIAADVRRLLVQIGDQNVDLRAVVGKPLRKAAHASSNTARARQAIALVCDKANFLHEISSCEFGASAAL